MNDVRKVQITVDCTDPWTLSLFWNDVLGYVHPAPPPGSRTWEEFNNSLPAEMRNSASASEDPSGAGPRIYFQRVPESKAVKNRLHLDVRAAPGLEGDQRMAELETEAARLIDLGARRLQRVEPHPPMGAGHIVMQDPEGNEFCLQ